MIKIVVNRDCISEEYRKYAYLIQETRKTYIFGILLCVKIVYNKEYKKGEREI